MKKKFLALVMTLSMVLSLVPMTALATEGGEPTEQPITTTEGQPAGESTNGSSQDGGDNSAGGDSADTNKTPDANTENKDESKNGESENTGGTTTGGTPETGTEGSGSTSSGGGTGGGSTTESTESETPTEPEASKNAAKIGKNEYETLDKAIAAAEGGAIIEVLADCTTAGLNLSKDLTIQGAAGLESKPTITFTDKGIALQGKALIFKNCNVKMTGIGSTPYTPDWSWMTISASKDASLTLDGATMTMDGKNTPTGGLKNTHAIYFCKNNELNIINNSKLEIKNYSQDALEWDGGNGGYNVNIENSTFISDHNRSGFTGTFYATINNSTVKVINSTGNGSNGSHFDIKNRSNVEFNNNGSHGLSAGNLTINNSTVTANGNGANGIHTIGTLNICNQSNVEIKNNKCSISSKWTTPGAFYMGGTESKIEDSTLVIQDNLGSGIYQKNTKGTLTIADNATVNIMKNKAEKLGFGGGIYVNGTANISKNVELYNNHAEQAGDDIYNTGTITFGAVGNDWILDDCGSADNCNGKIYGWYDDSIGNRWNAHDKENRHIQEYDPIEGKFKEDTGKEDSSATQVATDETVVEIAPLALKAAHPLMFKVDYVVEGDRPNGYTEPKEAYYPADSMYTIESVPSSIYGTKDGVNGTYSFTGWKTENGENGKFVTGQQKLTKNTTLYGVWTFTKKSSGHRPSNPTVTIPDDVPTGLDLKNHYGYIIGYPVDYYTGKPTTDQTKKPVRPEGKITRAEVATIYFRMLTDENRAANWNQVSGFSDVKRSAWYNNAISTLTKAGILKGYEDGTFQPNGYITRAEFATIAIRFFSGVYEGEDLFPDIKGHWAEDYINNAANKGLVKGYEDGTFGPDRYITRAEAVTLVNRTLNRHPHNDGLHQDMLRWPDNMDTSKWYYADMQEATNSHEPDKNKSTADKEYWGKMLPIRDWEALEKEWSNANSAPGEGEVV